MLHAQTFFSCEQLELAAVACTHRRGRGRAEEQAGGHALVFVRRGCFTRSADGIERVLDPTVAYCMNPDEEHRYDHPHDQGDDCTALSIRSDLVASLWGGDPTLPRQPLPTTPEIDLEHRLLLSASRRGADRQALLERAIVLIARTLEQADVARVASGRPATALARRAIADGVRELLAENTERSLVDLADALAVSPHHLSRVFATTTGHTISRHRMRLRTRAVLERLAGGERDLARLAADVGFADHAHLCRVARAEFGATPSALRAVLA
jgi:AraC-like DNA-binding protein